MNFSFRQLTQADKPFVLAISAKIWDGDDYIPASFDSWINDKSGRFTGCFYGDTLVGFGRLAFAAPGHAWLEGLRKDQDCSIRGVGRALCLEFLRILAAMPDIQSIRFTSYFDSRASIALNEALGFRRIQTYSVKSKRLSEKPAASGRAALSSDACTAARRCKAAGWFKDFRLESWRAYPCGGSDCVRESDLIFAHPEKEAWLIASLDPYKAQANIVALDAPNSCAASELCAAFEAYTWEHAYTYIEVIIPQEERLCALFNACGYASWEQEHDLYVYEFPLSRLSALHGQAR